jgi:hypothetical protein
MKSWLLIVCIFVIFTIVCLPVLAISKADLIAYYRTTPESPAHPDNNQNPTITKYTGPYCTQSCFCKRPSDGAIVSCICGAVDTSMYYRVITTCYNLTPTPTPTIVPISDLGDLTGKPIFSSVPSDKQSFLYQVIR